MVQFEITSPVSWRHLPAPVGHLGSGSGYEPHQDGQLAAAFGRQACNRAASLSQESRPVRSPMQDAQDVQSDVIGGIENHVLSIGMDAGRRAELRPEPGHLRILQQQLKDSLEPPQIGFGRPCRPGGVGV